MSFGMFAFLLECTDIKIDIKKIDSQILTSRLLFLFLLDYINKWPIHTIFNFKN